MHAWLESSGTGLNWDAASQDYARYRPGYPKSFFRLLRCLGLGLAGQRILDLGTGTGALAVPFAQQGARVTGLDLSQGQLAAARQAARRHGVRLTFRTGPAEATGLRAHSFDVISASMCWAYFDPKRVVPEVVRLLVPGGHLLIASLLWDAEAGEIERRTQALLSAFNPKARRRRPAFEPAPRWAAGRFRLRTFHRFRTTLWFRPESWRGRIRASKWIGAALPAARAQAFDRELAALLARTAPPKFPIQHEVRLQIFAPV